MTEFEQILMCILILLYGILFYLAGKGNLFKLVPLMLQKRLEEITKADHGEWYVDEFPKQGKKFIICSECRSVIDCSANYIDENEYDFCPYCGVDMRKEGADNG